MNRIKELPEPVGKNRLKELRNQRKLTLDDIEEKTGIRRGTYSNYENGKTEPKMETWKKLADYYGVTVPYIQGEFDTKYLEKLIELLMIISFSKMPLKYREYELDDSYRPLLTIAITSEIAKLLGFDPNEKLQEIYTKAMKLVDNSENINNFKYYKGQLFDLCTNSEKFTNELLKKYENLEEK